MFSVQQWNRLLISPSMIKPHSGCNGSHSLVISWARSKSSSIRTDSHWTWRRRETERLWNLQKHHLQALLLCTAHADNSMYFSNSTINVFHRPSALHNKPCLPLTSHSVPVCLWHPKLHLAPSSRAQPTAPVHFPVCVRLISLALWCKKTDNYNVHKYDLIFHSRYFIY